MKQKPIISPPEFFALTEVRAAQDVQKQNPYGSKPHREAFKKIKAIAARYGVGQFIGDY